VIEGYWKCIGNGDTEGLEKYATGESLEAGKILIALFDETQRETIVSTYKVLDIIGIEQSVSDDAVFNCYYKDNMFSGDGNTGPNVTALKKEGGKWKIWVPHEVD